MASTTYTSTITATATSTPKVDAGNLANGLFTDFAPLLQLFGDEVTKQFLATSMGLGDDILLSIAPIGIITIVVCAIRIRGYTWMKAMIGRARDSPDDEEKDILPLLQATRHFPWPLRGVPQSSDWNTSRLEKHLGGIWTLEEALQNNPSRDLPEPIYRIQKKDHWFPFCKRADSVSDTRPSLGSDSDTEKGHDKTCDELADLVQKKSPNLTLNIPAAIPTPATVWLFASIGFVLQATVLIYNALVVYHYRWPRGGYIVESYGYPVWASGTLCISIGVCLCAWIVDSSTTEFTAEPIPPQEDSHDTQRNSSNRIVGSPFRVFRLQKPIPSLNLPAFALFNKETDPHVLISSRILPDSNSKNDIHGVSDRDSQAQITSDKKRKFMAIFTAFGALITVSGFVLQNIGTRELHWSAGVAQLISTLVLVVIRALVRRHVGDPPDPFEPLAPGYEATQMVMIINRLEQLEIRTGTSGLWTDDAILLAKSLPLSQKGNSITAPANQPAGTSSVFPTLLSSTLDVSDVSDLVDHPFFQRDEGSLQEHLQPALEAIRKRFLEILPCKTGVHNMAIRVVKSCDLILQALEIGSAEWFQPISVKILPTLSTKAFTTEQIQGVKFFNLSIHSPLHTYQEKYQTAFEKCAEQIESLLAYSICSYSKSKPGVLEADAPAEFLRILGFCPPDQEPTNRASTQKEESQYQKKSEYFRQWSGSLHPPVVYDSIRQSNGQARLTHHHGLWRNPIGTPRYGKIDTETVFCIEYSAIGYSNIGVEHTRNGEIREFFSPIGCSNGLLGAFVYDIMATFLLVLVQENKDELRAKLERSNSFTTAGGSLSSTNDLFRKISSILVEQKIIDQGEADRFVLAAFLACDLFPPDP